MKRNFFWIMLGIALFALYGYLGYASAQNDGVFNSPDETANSFFLKTFRDYGTISAAEPLSAAAEGTLRPRSVAVRNGNLVPESFHGLPVIYGFLSRFLGADSWLWFTAAFAALAVLAWRRAVETVFGISAGRYAAFLLALAPAWWYWGSRGLYHNTFFVSLLIFAAYFLLAGPVKRFWNRPHYDFLAGGLLTGLAVWVRTSEAAWILVIAAVMFFIYARELGPRRVILFFAGLALAFVPLFSFNQSAYGHPFSSGYTLTAQEGNAAETAVSVSEPALSESIKSQIKLVQSAILPFGLHPRLAAENFLIHFVRLPAWISAVVILSLLWLAFRLFKEQASREETVLALVFLAVTLWLAAVYGSWLIHDNPDPNQITIGTSYSRYWLPIWVLGSAVGGLGIAALHERFSAGMKITSVLIFAAMFVLSWNVTFNTPGDGLVHIANTLDEYSAIKKDVLLRVPRGGVIITDRADKIFFPDRKVMLGLREDSRMRIFERLSLRAPLYYYGITLTQDDLEFQNQRFQKIGLRLRRESTYTDSSLYRLDR